MQMTQIAGVIASMLASSAASGALAAIAQASTRRVDVVMLGDSNHFFSAYGFAWGLSRALAAKYGIYATGIIAPTGTGASDPAPTDYLSVNGTDNGWQSIESGNSAGNSAGFSALDALWWTGQNTGTNLIAPRARWIGTTATANLGGIQLNEGHPIGLDNALRFHIGYTRAPSGPLSGGSITPNIRYARGSTATLVAAGAWTVSSTGGSAAEVAVSSYDLAAGARTAGADIIMRAAGGVAGTAPFGYLFSRVENPNRNNGLSFHNLFATAGKSAYDMGMSLITHSTIAKLSAYFGEVRRLQLSKGQSPLVVIYINTNLNDNNPAKSPSPSLGPLGASAVAGSSGAYVDNLTAIKNRIEAVWTANGWPTSELHWLFVPSHVASNFGAELPVYQQFRDALSGSSLASAARTTVIDLSKLTVPGQVGVTAAAWQTAAANLGWYSQQTWNGSEATPNPPPDVNMIHLSEATNAGTATAASRGYDGVSAMIAALLP